ncbi:long-chain fatty acid--CoA ligase [Rhodococcus sp. NPDC019627]|uniref:acyl-CoA synthetase n=1 Tax=unclassified Rhodococcus (in: high G+C Gram-positive bacteria) TaxID=192944 RepID=UPI0034058E71
MPADITAADTGLGSWPRRRARITPDRLALTHRSRSLTYAELADRAAALASAWTAAGVRAGDRIAYLGPNDLPAFESLFASGLLGAVFVPLNTRLSPREIDYMLRDAGVTVLVLAPTHHHIAASLGHVPDTVRQVLALDPVTCPLPCTDYEQFLAGGDPAANFSAVGLNDPCLILYTSGTTGTPKGAVLTHGNLTFNTLNQLAHIDVLSTDRALALAPMFHVTGLNQVTLPTLFKGGTVIPVQQFDAGEVLATIAGESITSFSAVPTILQMLCEHPDWDSTDISSLRYLVYGGSPVLERVATAWLDRGVQLLQGYGMTEAAAGVYMAIPDGAAEHPVSVGFPHFYTDVALASEETATPVGPGRSGELLVRGPNVFAGYWNRPEATSSSFTGDGWFHTGDVVATADDGWTSVVDRVKDIIISGGENIYPAEVEAVLSRYPGVVSAAVVGVPDAKWGEVGAAFVVTAGATELDQDQVNGYLQEHLARYKIPKTFRFVSEIPRNATGKIQRAQLRDLAAADPTAAQLNTR